MGSKLWHYRFMHLRCFELVIVIVVCALGGCAADGDAVPILESNQMAFDDLFVFEDSIRLDPAVLLGRIMYLDVGSSKEFLVSDYVGQGVCLFSPTGALVGEMVIDECAPGADGFQVSSAVFASETALWRLRGERGYVFDRDGNCLESKKSLEFLRTQAICAQGDTIFAWQQASRDGRGVIGFSDQLEPVIQIDLPPPKFPVLSRQYFSGKNRTIACFDDGPWYKMKEDVDARPLQKRSDLIQFKPFFFRSIEEDMLPIGDAGWKKHFANAKGTWTGGVFELTGSIHLVMYTNIPKRFHNPAWKRTRGLSIVDHADYSFSASTIVWTAPLDTRDGYAYFEGAHEQLADGLVGNPVILRYRFLRP